MRKGKYLKKPKHNKSFIFICLTLLVFMFVIVSGCTQKSTDITEESMQIPETTEPVMEEIEEVIMTKPTIVETEPEPVVYQATIGAMGDLLMHSPIFNGIAKQSNGTYDFESIFKYIRKDVSALDCAVVNLETTLCGTNNGYTYKGYPHFNCPDSIIDGVKAAGFDTVLTANNHSYDTGLVGYKRTLDVIRKIGLNSIGTYSSPDEIKWFIQDVNGINIGMLCYTYATSVTDDGRPSLNGNSPIKEAGLCNYFDYNNLGAFYAEVEQYLAEMNEADATIMFIHWGEEYQLSANDTQKAIAQRLCDMGIDVIIGGHPHVVQPIELLESNIDLNHKTVCIYSVGNAVSNQRVGNISYVNTAHTEDGILFSITFEKIDNGDAYVRDVCVIPTWVYMHNNNGAREYNIIPLDVEQTDNWKEMFGFGNSTMQKAKDSYQRTMDIVGDGLNDVKEYLAEQFGVG